MEGLVTRAYTRVSTDEQAASGFSLAAQRERLQAFAKSQGWSITKFYTDDGYSAKDTKRPAIQELLKDLQKGEVVLVYKLDRLTRSVADLHELLRVFDDRGALFKSATEEFNTTTSHGRLMINLVAVLAQWERENIGERAKMGKQKKAALGEWNGGPVPFGYQAVPSGKLKAGRDVLQLVPDPERAHIVPQIFERYLSGFGVRAICIWLNNELGLRTTRGGRWSQSSLVVLLTNPVYCGDVAYGKKLKSGVIQCVRGIHEPLVSRDVFEQVQQVFAMRKGMAPRHATGKYPLTGIAKCGVCGGSITMVLHWKKEYKHLYYYRCLNWRSGRGCGNEQYKPLTSVSARVVEENLVEAIHRLQEPAYLEDFLKKCDEQYVQQAGMTEAETRRLEADLSEAETAIRRWDRAYETGALEWDEYWSRVQPHKERLRNIREQLARVKGTPPPPPRAELASFAFDFKLAWSSLQPRERKALLQRFVRAFNVEIVLYPDCHVEMAPAPPTGLTVDNRLMVP